MRVKSPRDFWAGVMFAGVGVFFAAWSAVHYEMGTTTRMGAGYFPAVLGGLLALLGLIVLFRGLASDGAGIEAFRFRPLLLVSASVVAYGYLMKPGGLAVATAAAVVIGALAGDEFKWKEVLVVALALVLCSWLVFVKGLALPFPVCPEFIENCPVR